MQRTVLSGAIFWGAIALSTALTAAAPVRAADTDIGLDAATGRKLFLRPWVSAPSTTRANDGLGPLYNARSCGSCHPGTGAGDLTPEGGLVLRLADDPVYGQQLQTAGVHGQTAEGRLSLRWESRRFSYPDGRKLELRRPIPVVEELSFGTLTAAGSLRRAPDLHGLGLLEKVALPDQGQGGTQTGRFGWKADQPTLSDQSAGAFHLDIGMSTPRYPEPWGDCTAVQTACRAGPHGAGAGADNPMLGDTEISPTILSMIDAYLKSLPPRPASRPAAKPDEKGAKLFTDTGCAACHTPVLPLADGSTAAAYTDMRLHDMGPELADGVAGVTAAGNQWRTAPLWTIQAAGDNKLLLHDGRAASVEEAILWHGGEAQAARDRFIKLSVGERSRLLHFVNSL